MQSTTKTIKIRIGEEFTPQSHISIAYRNLGLGGVAAGAPASNTLCFTFNTKPGADPFEIGQLSGMCDSFIAQGLATQPPGMNFQCNTTVEEGFFMGDPSKLKFTFNGLHGILTDQGPPGAQEFFAVVGQAAVPSASIVLNFNGDLTNQSDDWLGAELVVTAEVVDSQMLKAVLLEAPEPFRILALFNNAFVGFDSLQQLKTEWGLWPQEIDELRYSNLVSLIKMAMKFLLNSNNIYLGADLEQMREPFGTMYDSVQNVLSGSLNVVLNIAGHELRVDIDIPFLSILPKSFNAIGADILS